MEFLEFIIALLATGSSAVDILPDIDLLPDVDIIGDGGDVIGGILDGILG